MTQDPPETTPVAPGGRLELKAGLLLVLFASLVLGAIVYVLYARGAFEPTQRLVLIADDVEGVIVGMDLTFSGFPIGRVSRVELGEDGAARILIDVPTRDARWLRTSSVYTLVRGIVGGTSLRAYTGILSDPPLPDGAQRRVLSGDAAAELPRMLASVRELIQNLGALTATDSALAASLANVDALMRRLNDERGALGVLFGNPADARKVVTALERSNALLQRIDALTARVDATVARADAVVARADAQVLGADGILPATRETIRSLDRMLGEARETLQRVDGILQEAQTIATETRVATTDLGALRTEVEASLRKVEQLVNEVNRMWPFARDTEIKLR